MSRDLSVRGVYRRYYVEPRKEMFGTDDPAIVGDPSNLSVKKDLLAAQGGWLRAKLDVVAFRSVGLNKVFHNVCDNIKARQAYTQVWTHIEVRVQLVPDNDVPAGTMGPLRQLWANGIHGIWNSPAHAPGETPRPWVCSRPGEVRCRVSFRVLWVTSHPHHVVAVHLAPPGVSPRENQRNWYTSTLGDTAAHEFGHMLGLLDEYPDADLCPGRSPIDVTTVMGWNTQVVLQRHVAAFAAEIGSNLS